MQANYSVFPTLQKLLFSPLCPGCGLALKTGQTLCFSCRRSVLSSVEKAPDYLLNFSGSVPAIFAGLRKLRPHQSSALLLRLLEIAEVITSWQQAGIDLVVTAPQKPREGPSGLAMVAEGIAERLGAHYHSGLLKKKKDRTQHGRAFRSRVDTECFVALAEDERHLVAGKNILLMDDVLTTGTTLELSAYVLRRAGAKGVRAYALAHQMMPSFERKSEETHEESGEVNPFLLHLRM